jgi:transcriptional regulator with XRE-family HTH domain
MDMQKFATRLRAVREERNVSVTELAEHLGVNKTTIYRYETGAFKALKADSLIDIAEYLGVDPDYLTGESDIRHAVKEAEALMADITDEEKMLLELFRRVPVENQQMVLGMIRVALKNDQ